MCCIIIPPLLLIDNFTENKVTVVNLDINDIAFLTIITTVYFNKDFIYGRSLAKRLMGLVIIDNRTNGRANSLKCFLRNLTIPIWPIEVIMSLINPSRRLGDYIANTRVETTESKGLKSIKTDCSKISFDWLLGLTVLVAIIFSVGLEFLLTNLLKL